MNLDIVPLQPLERGQLHVMRVRSLIGAIILLVMAAVGEIVFRDKLFLSGVILLPVLALTIWTAGIAPARRWRHWGYAFTGTELHVAHGWLFRSNTVVPVGRVQHIDVLQGPVERAFGVARLELHTAGTENSVVELPGISWERAGEIRDAIRSVLTDDPW